jgi:excisionase family DNA binding protein
MAEEKSIVPERPLTQRYSGLLLTVGEVSQILRVNATTIRRWAKDGTLQVVKLPSRAGASRQQIRVKGETVDALIYPDASVD